MIIELSKYKITTKEELSFGDLEDIQSEIGAEQNLIKVSGKLIELAILEIKEGENIIPYSNEWRRNLSLKDGVKLSTEIQKLITGIDEIVKKN